MFLTYTMTFLVLFTSLVVLNLITPFWLIGALVFQTLVVGLYMYSFKLSLWMVYILFLVFLGGMLVIFSYVAGLVSMESLETMPYILLMGGGLLYWSLMMIMYLLDFMVISQSIFMGLNLSFKDFTEGMYTYMSFYIYWFVVVYLLLALIIVANLAKSKLGPLRLVS